MLTDPVFWLVAIPAVLITGISKSGFAGGVGGLTVPLLALAISPATAAAIMLPLLIYMDFLSVRSWWGQHNPRQLWILLPAAIVGIGIAYWLFDRLNEDYLRAILGCVSLGFGLYGLVYLVKLVPYSLLGQINQGNILISLLLAPLAWLGVKLGLSIQDKISDRLFKRIILILMVLVGIRLLWTAL